MYNRAARLTIFVLLFKDPISLEVLLRLRLLLRQSRLRRGHRLFKVILRLRLRNLINFKTRLLFNFTYLKRTFKKILFRGIFETMFLANLTF